MAKIDYGPLVSRVTGKLGGVVFRGAGSRGICQSRGVRGGGPSSAQARHRQYLAECQKSYVGLVAGDRESFDFSVSEGYEVRTESGGVYNSGLAAYTAWYLVMRYTNGSTEAPSSSAQARTLGRSELTEWAGWVSGGTPHLRVYHSVPWWTFFALWLTPSVNSQVVSSRAGWTLVYPAAGGPAITWTATGLPGSRAFAFDFGPYLAAAVPQYRAGSNWGVRFYNSAGYSRAWRYPPFVVPVGSIEPGA